MYVQDADDGLVYIIVVTVVFVPYNDDIFLSYRIFENVGNVFAVFVASVSLPGNKKKNAFGLVILILK